MTYMLRLWLRLALYLDLCIIDYIFKQILYGVSNWPTVNSCIFNQNDM